MKRRDFIVKSGIVSTGILTSSAVSAVSCSFMPSDTINIGVIGTGDRGTGLTPFLNEIEGINVSACCDVLPFRLENGLKAAGNGAIGYTNYRELLANKDIDAVLVTTPFSMHSQIASDAIDAGKHVYCEKTMAKDFS
ncbi:MAG: Gfo/Idh/MocA family oxidoreductase, partial [Maribacter sp.]